VKAVGTTEVIQPDPMPYEVFNVKVTAVVLLLMIENWPVPVPDTALMLTPVAGLTVSCPLPPPPVLLLEYLTVMLWLLAGLLMSVRVTVPEQLCVIRQLVLMVWRMIVVGVVRFPMMGASFWSDTEKKFPVFETLNVTAAPELVTLTISGDKLTSVTTFVLV